MLRLARLLPGSRRLQGAARKGIDSSHLGGRPVDSASGTTTIVPSCALVRCLPPELTGVARALAAARVASVLQLLDK